MKNEEYKKLSIKEFTKAAGRYESSHAGIYEMCKDDYPPILAELEKEAFTDVLDCGCGTGPMLELLHDKYPDKHYVGLDLTPEMIHVAQAKNLSNTEFLVGDSENLPFDEGTFDAIICSNSFHHYPNPQNFFNSAYRVLRRGGRLILRDYTSSDFVVWLMNHIEMPLANLCGHGDVKILKAAEFTAMAENAGFTVLTMEKQKGFRVHLVARKMKRIDFETEP